MHVGLQDQRGGEGREADGEAERRLMAVERTSVSCLVRPRCWEQTFVGIEMPPSFLDVRVFGISSMTPCRNEFIMAVVLGFWLWRSSSLCCHFFDVSSARGVQLAPES
jgi:hypothetical protein